MRIVFLSSTSVCLEMENTLPYYASTAFEVAVNGENIGEKTENVFSLFNLKPDTMYEVKAGKECVCFRTKAETCMINVSKNGAKGDGKTDDTMAIQTCIFACPDGGRVYVPAGKYVVAPLFMRDNITLELAKGATLLGICDKKRYLQYPALIKDEADKEIPIMTWEGNLLSSRGAFINAYRANNFQIIGEGVIDANSQKSGWWKKKVIRDGKRKGAGRPRLFFFNDCKNIALHGIHGCNSPSWSVHPFFCENLGFYNIKITAPADSHNTDGIDPECCKNIEIIGCEFSTGDDCIALKAGKMHVGMYYQTPTENTVIRNCLMRDGHGAIVLGSEMSGGIRDLTVSQCLFQGTDRGLRIKTCRGRGKYAVIDGVEFDNIRMENVKVPLVINMYYNCDPDGNTEYVWSREKWPVDDGTPYFGAFTFKNMVCVDAEYAAGYFDGLVEMPIESVTIENVSVSFKEEAQEGRPAMQTVWKTYCKAGWYFDNVKNVNLHNARLQGVVGEEIIQNHCQNVTVTDDETKEGA